MPGAPYMFPPGASGAYPPQMTPAPPPPGYPPQGYGMPYGSYAPPTLSPGFTPYAAPPPPKRNNTRLFIIFGVIAAVIIVASLGALGFVLSANGGGSDASHVATVAATPTPTLNEQQIFRDPLTANTYGWPTSDHCFFESDGYHVKGTYGCYAPTPAYLLDKSDTTVNVKLAAVSGGNAYGLLLRIQHLPGAQHNRFYAFVLASNGAWSFQRCDGTCDSLVDFTQNAAIHAGVGATNTLRAIAEGSSYTLYVNGTQVGHVDDAEFTDGQTGLSVSGTCEAVFTNILINQIN